MDSKVIIGALIIAALAGGGGYYAGSKFGSSSSQRGNFTARTASGQAQSVGVRFSGGGAAFGEIISKDANSITVKLAGGSQVDTNGGTGSKIVLINSSTEVMKSTSGSLDDLSVGTSVMVNGTQNSDGSISAKTVQIRPASMNFNQGGKPQTH